MDTKQAIKLAIETLKKERQGLAFDANVVRSYGSGSPVMEKKAKRYAELCEAIRVLEEIGDHTKKSYDGFRQVSPDSGIAARADLSKSDDAHVNISKSDDVRSEET